MRNILRGFALWIQHNSVQLVRSLSNDFYYLLWNLIFWLSDRRFEVHQLLEGARTTPWLEWIPGWQGIIDILQDVNSWVFGSLVEVPVRGANFLRDHYNDDYGEFSWVVTLIVAGDYLVELATRAGESLDSLGAAITLIYQDLELRLRALIAEWQEALLLYLWNPRTGILDPVGEALGELWRLLAGMDSNPWPAVKSGADNYWIAFGVMFRGIWDAIWGRLRSVADEARDVAVALIAVALFPVHAWIAQAQLALDWVRQSAQSLQVFLDDPLEWWWTRVETKLWPKVEGWLIKLWDGTVG